MKAPPEIGYRLNEAHAGKKPVQCDNIAALHPAGMAAIVPVNLAYSQARVLFRAAFMGRASDSRPFAACFAFQQAALGQILRRCWQRSAVKGLSRRAAFAAEYPAVKIKAGLGWRGVHALPAARIFSSSIVSRSISRLASRLKNSSQQIFRQSQHFARKPKNFPKKPRPLASAVGIFLWSRHPLLCRCNELADVVHPPNSHMR